MQGPDYISQRAWQSGGLCASAVPVVGNHAAGWERGVPSGPAAASSPLGPVPFAQLCIFLAISKL